jgi:hypothetical protein
MNRAVLLLVFFATSSAFAATSVWDDAKHDSNQFTGKVVSIGNDGNDMFVRISNGKESEVFRVCSTYPGGDATNLAETDRVRSIREAFNHGDIVVASYNGPFERCLSYVEVRKDEKDSSKLVDKTARQ